MLNHLPQTLRLSHLLHAFVVDQPLFDNITLDIPAGQCISIMGRSGSGKTTLLRIMAGLLVPQKGSVYYGETDICHYSEDQRATFRLGQCGFVFQDFQLLDHMNILENLRLPLWLQKKEKPDAEIIADLANFGLEAHHVKMPSQLSGGEKQRVGILRALYAGTTYIFADEPTGNLDDYTAERIGNILISAAKNQGSTLIIVTHDHYLSKLCDKTVTLYKGHLHENA